MSVELWVANVTPFTPGGEVDRSALAAHTEWLAEAGIHGFAPAGTTGGFLYLAHAERRAIHQTVLAHACGRPVIPCVWDPLPARAADLARAAEAEGAAAVFLPPPLYHEIGDDAIIRWYAGIREAVSIPVMAYHHPRTHNPLGASLVSRLLDDLGLAALKDSSCADDRVRGLAARWPGRILVGGDGYLGRAADLGPIRGHISGLANGWPHQARALVEGRGDRAWLQQTRATIKAAGGTANAIRAHLGMGCRAPLNRVVDAPRRRLPAHRYGSQ